MIPINGTTILIAVAIIAGILALILRHEYQKDTRRNEQSWNEFNNNQQRIEELKEELKQLEGK